jgi:predicted RNase H-like HicB family nuclease
LQPQAFVSQLLQMENHLWGDSVVLSMTDTMRQIVVFPGEDGYFVAECPSLPGCISQGKTKQEAIANIREAIEAYIDSLLIDGYPVPEEHFETLLMAV